MEEIKARSNGYSHVVADAYGPELTKTLTLEEVTRLAIDAGVDVSSTRHQSAIAARRARARQLNYEQQPHKPPEWFKKAENFIIATGNVLVLSLMLVLSYVMPPVAIMGLAYAEIQRVGLGVQLFDAPRASLMATVAITTYLALLVVKAGMISQQPQSARSVWSLRLFLRSLGYALGIGRHWQARNRSSLQLLESATGRLGWLIIVLGTAGSMEGKLRVVDGAWHRAIVSIFADSTLIDFFAYVGGFLLTAALLASMHFAVEHVFNKYVRIVPETTSFFDLSGNGYAEDEAEILYLLSQIQKQNQKTLSD